MTGMPLTVIAFSDGCETVHCLNYGEVQHDLRAGKPSDSRELLRLESLVGCMNKKAINYLFSLLRPL